MKVSKLAIALAMAGGFSATSAFAQSSSLYAPVQRTAFEYGSYDYYAQDEGAVAPSSNDRIVPEEPAAEATGSVESEAYSSNDYGTTYEFETYEPGCSVGYVCNDEASRLFGNSCTLNNHGLKLYGWVSQGFTANFDRPADRFNGPAGFNDRSNDYQLNQAYAVLEKPLDTSCGWDIGGRVDLLYGSDYRYTLSRGWDAEGDGSGRANSGRFYGLSLPQAYVEVGNENLSIKLGHFYSILGHDKVTAPDNFFYSQSYARLYGEPFTHTGALATYRLSDRVSIAGGITNGWNNFDDRNDAQSFLGKITLNNWAETQSLSFGLTNGQEEIIPGSGGPTTQRTMYSVVYTNSLTSRLHYVAQLDHGWQHHAADAGASDAQWYGINQQLIYDINCCWSVGGRFEWFRDDDGYRVSPVGDFAGRSPVNNNTASAGGFEGDFIQLAVGLNYKPTANLRVRPELRYDQFNGNGVNGVALPFDDGSDSNQFLAAFDVIYLW